MTQIPATTRHLRASAAALRKNADTLAGGNGSLLLRFYSVECAMKDRYLCDQRAAANGDTSMLKGAFGASGHDLDAGRKALKAPASLPAAPVAIVRDTKPVYSTPAPGGPTRVNTADLEVTVEGAHQLWRYGIPHEGTAGLEAWLKKVAEWLEQTR